MKNGTALKAISEELNQYASEHSTLDYYQQTMPSAYDLRLDEAVKQFMAAGPADRETFQSSLTPAALSHFGIYGHRAATRAMRENNQDYVQKGLVGAVIANYVVPDKRRVETGLAIYYHPAAKLGVNPLDLFTLAAGYATDDLAAQLVAFGNRADVSLKKYGWKEIDAPDGILYKFNWQ